MSWGNRGVNAMNWDTSNSDVMNLKHWPRRFTRVRSGNEQSSLAQKIPKHGSYRRNVRRFAVFVKEKWHRSKRPVYIPAMAGLGQ